MKLSVLHVIGRTLLSQRHSEAAIIKKMSLVCCQHRLLATSAVIYSRVSAGHSWGVPEGTAAAPPPKKGAAADSPQPDTGILEEELAVLKRRIEPTLAEGVEVAYARGLPQITVPLPSRREKCRFTLKPISNTVGDFIQQLHAEDKGIDRVILRTLRGTRIATSDSIEALMEEDFELVINDDVYHVKTPELERPSQEELTTLSNVRNLVAQLYEALNVEEHQLKKEREIIAQLENLRVELEPLEAKRKELEDASHRRTNVLTWVGLGLMGVQFGILARLTWWEYSWDIMEPVTYFVTYGTAMAAYAYFVITKQDYVLPDVKDRAFLLNFYRRSKKGGLDVQKYNQLRNAVHQLEMDLRRLRDPLQMHLPPAHLQKPINKQFSLNSLLTLLRASNPSTKKET